MRLFFAIVMLAVTVTVLTLAAGCYTQDSQTQWITQKTNYPVSIVEYGEPDSGFRAAFASDFEAEQATVTIDGNVVVELKNIGARRTDLQTATQPIVEAQMDAMVKIMTAIAEAAAEAAMRAINPAAGAVGLPDLNADGE